ncbi:hypothetical protein FB45DRAFT_869278 [Roridomyces roridus]|uniref:Uncharacterized protein n=1 Tax=Roridomyces roridus TaxID=1738132 RepID=A0AAD7BNV8_9AGAR|nr:hypothetical protein FB45DRAFT_869278 [Roridomyces roridus]
MYCGGSIGDDCKKKKENELHRNLQTTGASTPSLVSGDESSVDSRRRFYAAKGKSSSELAPGPTFRSTRLFLNSSSNPHELGVNGGIASTRKPSARAPCGRYFSPLRHHMRRVGNQVELFFGSHSHDLYASRVSASAVMYAYVRNGAGPSSDSLSLGIIYISNTGIWRGVLQIRRAGSLITRWPFPGAWLLSDKDLAFGRVEAEVVWSASSWKQLVPKECSRSPNSWEFFNAPERIFEIHIRTMFLPGDNAFLRDIGASRIDEMNLGGASASAVRHRNCGFQPIQRLPGITQHAVSMRSLVKGPITLGLPIRPGRRQGPWVRAWRGSGVVWRRRGGKDLLAQRDFKTCRVPFLNNALALMAIIARHLRRKRSRETSPSGGRPTSARSVCGFSLVAGYWLERRLSFTPPTTNMMDDSKTDCGENMASEKRGERVVVGEIKQICGWIIKNTLSGVVAAPAAVAALGAIAVCRRRDGHVAWTGLGRLPSNGVWESGSRAHEGNDSEMRGECKCEALRMREGRWLKPMQGP